jgi:hypothetical protein
MSLTFPADTNILFAMWTQIFGLYLLHRFKIQPSTLQTIEWCKSSTCDAVPTDTRRTAENSCHKSHGLLSCDWPCIVLLIPRIMTCPEHVPCQNTCQLTDVSTASSTLQKPFGIYIYIYIYIYTVIPRLTSDPANEDFFAVFWTRLTNVLVNAR